MTLAIGICTSEGIILAADGRVSRQELGSLLRDTDTAEKIHGVGRFAIALAGFKGLTDELLRRLRDQAILEACSDVHEAKSAIEGLCREYMKRFEGGPRPSASLLLAGYERDQTTPRVYCLHDAVGFQSAPFNAVGTPTGRICADSLALLLFKSGLAPKLTAEEAKLFEITAIGIANEIDPAVGPPAQMAILTPFQGYQDISDQVPIIRQRSKQAIDKIRDAFGGLR